MLKSSASALSRLVGAHPAKSGGQSYLGSLDLLRGSSSHGWARSPRPRREFRLCRVGQEEDPLFISTLRWFLFLLLIENRRSIFGEMLMKKMGFFPFSSFSSGNGALPRAGLGGNSGSRDGQSLV